MGEKKYTNRLIREKSPYLLQHAHNPVDWYPWGDEAFAAAKAHDKPIFLSIGYATCHWCHTMEQESFENEEIAELMNTYFINIKVDREELPEVDALYMDFAQSMMAGSSGWPLNVILTPHLTPFFAATYLPPKSRESMLGLFELLHRIHQIWIGHEREKVEEQAARIVEFFEENLAISGSELPKKQHIQELSELFFKIADPIYGGLKGAPKFPVGYQYNFLLIVAGLFKDSRALFLVERTLDMMHRGGIYDHIGGGFSRYSVDNRWLIPHFEKMLYDNALLGEAYINAWKFTKKPLYKHVAQEVLDYILRDMTHPEGGFYSAEDADSEGVEGLFYIWQYQELEAFLGKERFKTFANFYGVTQEGNFEGMNVLHMPLGLHEFSSHHHIDPYLLEKELKEDREILFLAREKRVHPFKDDKVLTSWNGLMIHTMAEAGLAFNEPKYLEGAKTAISFIRTYLWHGREVKRRFRDGEALHFGGLEDYAFLIRSLLTLFEKGEGAHYLEWAMQLTAEVETLFKSPQGAFYQSDGQDISIILRRCSLSDGAEPSGNAVHTENLLRLYRLTLDLKYKQQAEDVLKAVKASLENYAPGYFYHVMNTGRYYDAHSPTYIIALNKNLDHLEKIKRAINESFNPYGTTIFSYPKEKEKLLLLLPFMENYPAKEEKTTFYKCFEGRCQKPMTDIYDILETLRNPFT